MGTRQGVGQPTPQPKQVRNIGWKNQTKHAPSRSSQGLLELQCSTRTLSMLQGWATVMECLLSVFPLMSQARKR